MRRALRCRLTYANVTATLALFVALGGSAYAGLTIDGGDVVDGSLTGRDIRNGSVAQVDLEQAVAARRRGRRGPRGPRGPRGRSGATRVIVKTGPANDCTTPSCASVEQTNSVSCDAGQSLVGGGAAAPQQALLVASRPTPGTSGAAPTGWEARARAAQGALQAKPEVWALCAQ